MATYYKTWMGKTRDKSFPSIVLINNLHRCIAGPQIVRKLGWSINPCYMTEEFYKNIKLHFVLWAYRIDNMIDWLINYLGKDRQTKKIVELYSMTLSEKLIHFLKSWFYMHVVIV